MKTISIIIPCYNHTAALVRSLQTLRNQSVKPTEVIIIDDGSDTSLQMEHLGQAAKDLPITIYWQKHAGAPAARNTGFSHASSEYVVFWDADLLAKPTMLAKMATALAQHSDASFVYSDYYFGKHKMRARPFSFAALKKQNYIHSSSMIRSSDVNPWDESLKKFQDWDFWLTLTKNGKKGYYIPELLFTLIPHKNGISAWLPSFAYKTPWKYLPGIRMRVQTYEQAKNSITKKHAL